MGRPGHRGAMPNHHLNLPLVEYVKGATHLQIRCVSPHLCDRSVTMQTADLIAKLPVFDIMTYFS